MLTKTLTPLAFLSLSSLASAQFQVDWSAASGSLPEEIVPAWELYEQGPCLATFTLGGGVLTQDALTGCGTEYSAYSKEFGGPIAGVPSRYRIEARLRIAESTDSVPGRGLAFIAGAPPSYCPWILEIDANETLLRFANLPVASFPFDATNGLHTYTLDVDMSTLFATASIDGQAVMSGPIPASNDCSTTGAYVQYAFFGKAYSGEFGVIEWESVGHDYGDGEDLACLDQTPNSLGAVPQLYRVGSRFVADNDVRLRVNSTPPSSFGYFLCSTDLTPPTPIQSSQGNLCLGGAIGRFNRPGEILAPGQSEFTVDLTDVPQPTGAVAVQPGESWIFQFWYRDANPNPTSNLSPALRVAFF